MTSKRSLKRAPPINTGTGGMTQIDINNASMAEGSPPPPFQSMVSSSDKLRHYKHQRQQHDRNEGEGSGVGGKKLRSKKSKRNKKMNNLQPPQMATLSMSGQQPSTPTLSTSTSTTMMGDASSAVSTSTFPTSFGMAGSSLLGSGMGGGQTPAMPRPQVGCWLLVVRLIE
jgi:hypothetical protein